MRRAGLAAILVLVLVAAPAAAGSWGVIETGHLRVMYEPAARETAERLASHGGATYHYLAGRLPTMPAPPWEIRIYSTQTSFMAGTGAADWMAAVATFRDGQNLIGILDREVQSLDPRYQPTLEQTLVHEMVHVALRGPRYRVSRWFDEGMAQYVARQWSPLHQDQYRSDVLGGVWLTLAEADSLLYYPTEDVSRISQAYRQAYKAVEFIALTFGSSSLFDIIAALDRVPFEDAVLEVTGHDLRALEVLFEDSIREELSGSRMSPRFWYGWTVFWLAVTLAHRMYLRIPRQRSLVDLP